MTKKSLIIYFSKLSIGGMERALIEFIKKSNLKKNYNITLYLGYVVELSYLKEVSKYANVKLVIKGKWNLFNKIVAYIKMNLECLRLSFLKNKYDCSICYTHHHGILSKLARRASNNNICFVHTDLLKSRSNDELNALKNKVKFDKFKKIICVSHCAKESFKKIYPDYKGRIVVANNYINGEDIISKSKEKVDDFSFDEKVCFINIARHLEFHKQISLIIEASLMLKKDNYDFKVLLLGDGPDHENYCDLIKKYNLENNVILLGSRVNPYKYLKKSSAFVFSSKFEGYGIVLDEARVLGIPLITTDVADSKMITLDGYGILCDNNANGIYRGMKKYLDEGFIPRKFDYKKFNDNITKVIDNIVKEENV